MHSISVNCEEEGEARDSIAKQHEAAPISMKENDFY
jgi:hypothetical protein